MLIPHLAVAGVVELLFTVAIFAFVKKTAPETIRVAASPKTKPLFILLFALICLSPIGLLASGTAWGEWGQDEIASVSSNGNALGFVPAGMKTGINLQTLMPDYSLSGLPEAVGYILAAFAGAAILVIAFKLMSMLLSRNGVKKTES
jgi:cobalt/nickel transport system permease protein